MGQEDWYRNTTWDKETSELFEAKLKRSRGAYHKAQYLRIQASHLLSSKDKELQAVGLELMERLIKDFPSQDFSTVFGKEQLGDYFFVNGDYENAEDYYRQVVDHYKRSNRGGTSGVADVKLVKTILESDQRDKFDAAYKLLTLEFEKTGGSLSLNDDRFFYASVLADLCDKLGKSDEARQYANKALEIARITEPQFDRHKTVGLVRTKTEMLDKLMRITSR